MPIKLALLKDYPEYIPQLAALWYALLGRVWMPDTSIDEVTSWYQEWLNDTIPLAYIALEGNTLVGSCSLQMNDGVRPDLKPWLGDLIVNPIYQNQGIGRQLIAAVKQKAASLGFESLYLFTFDVNLEKYYRHLGWQVIGSDQYQSYPVIIMQSFKSLSSL